MVEIAEVEQGVGDDASRGERLGVVRAEEPLVDREGLLRELFRAWTVPAPVGDPRARAQELGTKRHAVTRAHDRCVGQVRVAVG